MENQASSIFFLRFLELRIASLRMKICCLREKFFNLEKLGFQEIVNPSSFILSSSPTMVADPLGIKSSTSSLSVLSAVVNEGQRKGVGRVQILARASRTRLEEGTQGWLMSPKQRDPQRAAYTVKL
ncbi:unnamed protein product [Malus baccata var. baccata]